MASWWCGAFSSRKRWSSSRSSSPVTMRFSTIMFSIDRRKSPRGSSDCFTTAKLPSSFPAVKPSLLSQLFVFRCFGACGGGGQCLLSSLLPPLSTPFTFRSCCGGKGNGGGAGGAKWASSSSLFRWSTLFTFRCSWVVGQWEDGGGEENLASSSLLLRFPPASTARCRTTGRKGNGGGGGGGGGGEK
ncbi:Os04g0577600 [Oryza sativa Japonica Group]|uniref:Os04g0577600 protein n=2 Tax=Oryza sativa subsp. japonica TaxID=39947 RepID=Q0JAT9_ORYSJ|nr:hypothetical protein EE612_025100 [Oryza sativa]BAF15548.1 Os04g0577600 [Oryza sativa Japonica Group]BAS90622.1 Os04g0577600 [Oryza sativa Japonica Group]|eukprot:NP_001053634.1 Os04g0577600 [Oryza sativa Japonica Group]